MEPTNIIEFLNQIPGFSNSVSLIIGVIITAVFFKKKHSSTRIWKDSLSLWKMLLLDH